MTHMLVFSTNEMEDVLGNGTNDPKPFIYYYFFVQEQIYFWLAKLNLA